MELAVPKTLRGPQPLISNASDPTRLLNPPGVNFINILRTNFLYEHSFGSFFSSYMYFTCKWKKLPKRRSYEKRVPIKLKKLTAALLTIATRFYSLFTIWAFILLSFMSLFSFILSFFPFNAVSYFHQAAQKSFQSPKDFFESFNFFFEKERPLLEGCKCQAMRKE